MKNKNKNLDKFVKYTYDSPSFANNSFILITYDMINVFTYSPVENNFK